MDTPEIDIIDRIIYEAGGVPHGPHFCLGTHLARLELNVIFDVLRERMPDIEQAGQVRRLRSNFIMGVKELPVRFTPSPTRG